MQENLPYAKLYSDDSGVTHFDDESIPWQPVASGSQPVLEWITLLRDAQSIGYLRLAPGYFEGWHTDSVSRKQFVMVMSGVMEVEAGDGEKRLFTSGTVLLVTDISGRGNKRVS